MTPDREMVRRFIAALAGSPDAEMTWQLLGDDKSAQRYAVDYHMPLTDKLWAELVYQNRRGVGIFAMVNAGNGNGRRSANVTALRALFVDDDAGVLPPESECCRAAWMVGIASAWLVATVGLTGELAVEPVATSGSAGALATA